MPTAAAMLVSVAPAFADAGSAAPGVQTDDIGLFSSKLAELLQPSVATAADARPPLKLAALSQTQMVPSDANAAASASPHQIPVTPVAILTQEDLPADTGPAAPAPEATTTSDVDAQHEGQPALFMASVLNPLTVLPAQIQTQALADATPRASAAAAQPPHQDVAALTGNVANDLQPTSEKPSAAATAGLPLPAALQSASADQAEVAPIVARAVLKAAADQNRTQAADEDASPSDQKPAQPQNTARAAEIAPLKPLRHADTAGAQTTASGNEAAAAKGETSSAQKPSLTDAAPAASAARAPAPEVGAPLQIAAPAAQPAAPVAAAVEAQPIQQAVAAERSLSFSHLSQATIETTAHLAAQIARSLDGKSTRFDMVLTPEDLGRVDVSLEIGDDGQLAARLAFDNPAAAAELRGRADELRRQLQDAGFQLAGDALDFSHRDQPQGGDAFERQQQRNSLFGGGSRLALAADASSILTPGVWTNLSLTPDRVDMKV